MDAYVVGDEIVYDHEIVGDISLDDVLKTAKTVVDASSEVVPKVVSQFGGNKKPQQQLLTRVDPRTLRDAMADSQQPQSSGASFLDVMKKEYFGLPLWGLLAGGAAIGAGLYLFVRKK